MELDLLFLFSPAGPGDLSLRTLHAPFSGPVRLRARTDPTTSIADHRSPIKEDRRRRSRRLNKATPGWVIGGTDDAPWLLTQDHPHQIKVVDRHINQQGMPDVIVPVRFH